MVPSLVSFFCLSFPASSPYVTAVGATQGPESGTAEIVCTSDAGGVITTGVRSVIVVYYALSHLPS
jgi:subtilase family serine protease